MPQRGIAVSAAVEHDVDRNVHSGWKIGSIQLVCFRLAQEEYAIEITKVQEIILPGRLTRLPQSPDYVKGLLHLRGEVIPVVDLRLRFGLPEQAVADETRVVVLNVGGKTLGIVVDAVSEVIRVAQEQRVPPPPAVAGPDREYLTGLLKLDNRLLILLDVERLLGMEVEAIKEGLEARD
jgi:purine-binding chemotaxis protein CheW